MIELIISIIIGLIIFLFGLENFSNEIGKITSNKFSKILQKAVKNKYLATLTGFGVTAVLQSSTVTVLITLGLVNSGLISFAQSLGIIFGSHIGSTITAQLVALNIFSFAPVIMILGFLIGSFSRKYKYVGEGLFYFGLIFFGLNLISTAVIPLQNNPLVVNIFSNLSNIYLAIIAGFIFTAITNSSAVTIGVVIILAGSGLISLRQGIPISLGANLGTTLKILLASLKQDSYSKRVAVAHTMFSFLGILFLLPFIAPYTNFIQIIGGTIEQQIANAHTIFNILAACLFLVLIKPFQKVVEMIVPSKEEEILMKSRYLSEDIPNTEEAFKELEKEIKHLITTVKKMFDVSEQVIKDNEEKRILLLDKYANLIDVLTKTISDYLFRLSQRKHSEEEAEKILYLIRLVNELKQLGDIAENLGLLPKKLISIGIKPSKKSNEGLKKIYEKFKQPMEILSENFPNKDIKLAKNLSERKKLDALITQNYKENMILLESEKRNPASLFVEAISIYENAMSKLRGILILVEKYNKIK